MNCLSNAVFNEYFGKPRLKCTGGARFFVIKPDGVIYRCPHLEWLPSLGNMMDRDLRENLATSSLNFKPCHHGTCVAECGGLFTEQTMNDGAEHTGSNIIWNGVVNSHYAIFSWLITHVCNFGCPYCCSREWMRKARNNGMKVLSATDLVDIAGWVTDSFATGVCILLGGEPTMHEGFIPLCTYLLSRGWKVDVITNLSRPQPILDALNGIQSRFRKNMGILFSAHVHHSCFSINDSQEALRSIRKASPRTNVRLAYVMHEINKTALSPDAVKQTYSGLVDHFVFFDDIVSLIDGVAKNAAV